MALTRGARADEIRRLRAEGLTLREIGERLSVAKSVINRALYERVRSYERDYNRERYYTATCQMCGKRCTHNVHAKKNLGLWCQSCYRKHRKEALNAA